VADPPDEESPTLEALRTATPPGMGAVRVDPLVPERDDGGRYPSGTRLGAGLDTPPLELPELELVELPDEDDPELEEPEDDPELDEPELGSGPLRGTAVCANTATGIASAPATMSEHANCVDLGIVVLLKCAKGARYSSRHPTVQLYCQIGST
jgi:hypothetical protein